MTKKKKRSEIEDSEDQEEWQRFVRVTAIIVVLIVMLPCWEISQSIMKGEFWDWPSHGETLLNTLEEDLQTLEAYHATSEATYPSVPRGILAEFCWPNLEPMMEQNDSQYALELIGVWGDYGTPAPGGSTESLIDIVFVDGTRMQLRYWNGFLDSTLSICWTKKGG